MASLDIAFVKYANETLDNVELSLPYQVVNVFPRDLYAKLIITDQGDLTFHFVDDGSGNYISDTEWNLGLLNANSILTKNVPVQGTLPSSTSKHSFSARLELYTDSGMTKLYSKANMNVNVHCYIQQSDGWGNGALYKAWTEEVPLTQSYVNQTTKTLTYLNETDSLYIKYVATNFRYSYPYLGFKTGSNVLGSYPGITVGWLGNSTDVTLTHILGLYDYTNAPQPFTRKFIALAVKNDLNVDLNIAPEGNVVIEAGKVKKIIMNVMGGSVQVSTKTQTSSTSTFTISDFVVFNPLP